MVIAEMPIFSQLLEDFVRTSNLPVHTVDNRTVMAAELIKRLESLEEKIKAQNEVIEQLATALNETRDQVQALLDLNFPNRERWPVKVENTNNA